MIPPVFLSFVMACWPDGADGEPSETRSCDFGFILDNSTCVPETCGAGRWGKLPVDDATVYVDFFAKEGGDGTEAAPYATIQRGLDRAGALGGGLVAVAAGIYSETLAFTTDHADVHLAGRCRDMVILDATVGDGKTSGIEIDAGYAAVEVSGVTVRDSAYVGLLVYSGVAVVRDSEVTGSAGEGIYVDSLFFGEMTDLTMDGCLVEENTFTGLSIWSTGTRVTLRDTLVGETRAGPDGELGRGIAVSGGAILQAEGSTVHGNTEIGLFVSDGGSQALLSYTIISDTQFSSAQADGAGIVVRGSATLSADGCLVEGNMAYGMQVMGQEAHVALRNTIVRDTRPSGDGLHGRGIEVVEGATLSAEDCLIEDNTEAGLISANPGSRVTARRTTVRGTRPGADGGLATGVSILDGASLQMEDCLIEENTGFGFFATNPGTAVDLRRTTVRNTRPDPDGDNGLGIEVADGASLSVEGCIIERNVEYGLAVGNPSTRVSLRETIVADTQAGANGGFGRGIEVGDGATLSVESTFILRNTECGLLAWGQGTRVDLRDTTVQGTQSDRLGGFGDGVAVAGGALLTMEDSLIDANRRNGLLALEPGTRVILRDSTISATMSGADAASSVCSGLTAQEGAFVAASRQKIVSNQGPGLLANGATMECVECSIEHNQFAGAVVTRGGTLSVSESRIEGTTANVNLLGGAGVYAWPWDGAPPTLILKNTLIQDNPIAGVWLIGDGSYALTDNAIGGGAGESYGFGSRCGDAILACDGVSSWNGTSGLLLRGNELFGALGSGVFLDDSSALLDGNAYSGNSLDLVVQNRSCDEIPDGYSEAPHRDLCPAWAYPTCYAEFFYIALPAEPTDWDPEQKAPHPWFSTHQPAVVPHLPGNRFQ